MKFIKAITGIFIKIFKKNKVKNKGVFNMKINSIDVRNFRGLTIKIDDLEKNLVIFGKNDSGKTTLCKAILRVLDLNERRKRLEEYDSTDCNKKDIIIKLILNVEGVSDAQYSDIGKYVHNGLLHITLKSIFNHEINYYEDELFYGDESKDVTKVNSSKQSAVDKVLSVIYIDPNYKLDVEKKNYFRYHDVKKIEDGKNIKDSVKERIDELEKELAEDEIIKNMNDEINKHVHDESLFFNGMSFRITPNVTVNNLLKSLDVLPVNSQGNDVENIGDGKSKILSMILHQKSYDEDKIRIVIAEEPENHLYPLLQMNFISLIEKMKYSQLFITSHSSKIINLNKLNQIIKLERKIDLVQSKIFKISKEYFSEFGELMTQDLSEMLFYDNVLLVEGSSERYFYDLLMIKDEKFLELILNKNVGIFSVNSIAFQKTKKFLECLGVNVLIKTDNDIACVPHHKELKRYIGLSRVMKYISDDTKSQIKKLLNKDKIDNDIFTFPSNENNISFIEDKMDEIINLLLEENVILSRHHNGFEQDLKEYIGNEITECDIEELNKSKLINLHKLIERKKIDIRISDSNNRNPLVRFIHEL